MTHEAIATTFDSWAAKGDDVGMEEAHGDVVTQVVEGLKIGPGAKILDLGCGNGWATRMLAKKAAGTQAIGVDASPAMIARAEELHSYTIRARYERGKFEELEFGDGHFDHAFSMEALYYAVDLEKTLAELHRVLKEGGRADILIDYYEERPGVEGWPESIGLALQCKSESGWADAFRAAGFSSVETERVVDGRGPGVEGEFNPNDWSPDWETHVASHEAGTLWIRAIR